MRALTCAWSLKTGGCSGSVRGPGGWPRRPTSPTSPGRHLRGAAPLPKAEYTLLKQSVEQLAAVGRNLNQIARAMNQGDRPASPGRAEVAAMLKVSESLEGSFQGAAGR